MNFIDILSQHDIPYLTEGHHHCRTGWIQFDCPYCGRDSKKYHMGYSLDQNYCNCWRCGHHSLVNTLMEITLLSYGECQNLLKDIRPERQEKERVIGQLKLPKNIGPLQTPHIQYLQSRGYVPKELEMMWGIKGIGVAANLAWRVFIPIHHFGEIVSWTTRSISKGPDTTRYLSASPQEEAVSHKTLLYGEDYARHSIIVVEGPFDVWRIGPGAVATLGTGYKQSQLAKMIRYPVRAVCFDNERAAQQRAYNLVEQLSAFPGQTSNIVLDSKDAGEATEQEIRKLRKMLK